MTRTLMIVESFNDQAFVGVLLRSMDEMADRPIEIRHLHDVPDADGQLRRGKGALKDQLRQMKGLFSKSKAYLGLQHLAVLLDLDDESKQGGLQESLTLVNSAFGEAFGISPDLQQPGQPAAVQVQLPDGILPLQVSCFFVEDGSGSGDLDSLLRAVAASSCAECECLDVMSACVMQKTGSPMQAFDKQWVNYYLRSHASRKQLRNAEKKLHEVIAEQGARLFDLEHPLLNGLKAYLRSISSP